MSRFYKLCLFAVLLVTGGGQRSDAAGSARLVPTLLEDGVMYLRIGSVENGVAAEIATARAAFAATNRILGTILDLRFVEGGDPAAVPGTAAVFAGKKLPLAILVNGRTQGAAAALAATLRAARAGLVFGGAAAGIQPDYPRPKPPSRWRAKVAMTLLFLITLVCTSLWLGFIQNMQSSGRPSRSGVGVETGPEEGAPTSVPKVSAAAKPPA